MRPSRLIAAVLVAIVFGVSGCSGDDGGSDPEPRSDGVVNEVSTAPSAPSTGEIMLAPSTVKLSLEVVHPGDGTQVLSGEGELAEDSARITVDGTKAPNAAGFYGHHDSFEVVYYPGGLMAEVLPEDRWLNLSLETASSFVGADIARLRDLIVVDPFLLAAAVGGSEVTDGETVVTAEDSSVIAQLDELYGIEELAVAVRTDAEGRITRLAVDPVYELVRDTEAVVSLGAVWDFEPLDEAADIEFPPKKLVDSL